MVSSSQLRVSRKWQRVSQINGESVIVQEFVQDTYQSKIVRDDSEMMIWSERVQDCPKYWKCILHIISDTCCIQGLSAEGAKADVKKANARPSSQLQFDLISLFFSFLFVQIFPYRQVDRLFHMSHGAIPPSLMVLFQIYFLSHLQKTPK